MCNKINVQAKIEWKLYLDSELHSDSTRTESETHSESVLIFTSTDMY